MSAKYFASTLLPAYLAIGLNIAHAHVTIEPPQVKADSYQKLSFKVTHGCAGSPTHTVIINLPDNLHGAKPMPKPGWNIKLDIQPLAQPYRAHGRLITEEVRTITWHGGHLPNEYFDEFVVHVHASAPIGQLAIPVTQLCESGRLDWNEVASPQDTRKMPEAPAPILEIIPNTPTSGHQH
jgi:uncharacterized protein YcnI